MYSYLVDTIFPFLFEFASKLIGLTTCPLNDFKNVLTNGGFIPYTNLLTGATENLRFFTNEFTGNFLNLFTTILTFNVPSTAPLWVAMLLACINGFIVVAIFKFMFDIVF